MKLFVIAVLIAFSTEVHLEPLDEEVDKYLPSLPGLGPFNGFAFPRLFPGITRCNLSPTFTGFPKIAGAGNNFGDHIAATLLFGGRNLFGFRRMFPYYSSGINPHYIAPRFL